MYRFVDYLFYSSYKIQKLIYNIENEEDKIQILGEEFIGNNEDKCCIIYKNKIISLKSFFLLKDIDREDKMNKKFENFIIRIRRYIG